MFWVFIAPLAQLARAEAPVTEVPAEDPLPEVPYFKEYALKQVVRIWGIEEWEAFDTIIKKESGWDNTAQNPTSTAYGYGQFLNSTWAIVGCTKTSDPVVQIDCTIKYIEKVYGSPQLALKFHRQNNYY